jgi:hypothetical protein
MMQQAITGAHYHFIILMAAQQIMMAQQIPQQIGRIGK